MSESGCLTALLGLAGYDLVLSCESKTKKIKYTRHNASVYQVRSKIEFFKTDFIDLKFPPHFRPDIVFVKPKYNEPSILEDFNMEKHITPNLNLIFQKALTISQNVVIILPKQCDIQDISFYLGHYIKEILG